MRLHLIVLSFVATLALAFIACGGDDDDASDTGDGAPTATEAPTAAPTDSGDDDGEPTDSGDDDAGDATDAPDFSGDFGMPEAGSGGTGTIVIGDDTFEYDVIVCSTSDDGLTVWNGRGHAADGTPFVAQVSWMFGFEVNTEVSVGSETVSDEGSPHWAAEPVLEYAAGKNGVASLTYDASFTSTGGEAAEGSVDVVCKL